MKQVQEDNYPDMKIQNAMRPEENPGYQMKDTGKIDLRVCGMALSGARRR